MTDILSRIDQAIGCQQCGRDLGASPSEDFCCQQCQQAWHEQRADPKAVADSHRPDVTAVGCGNVDCGCSDPELALRLSRLAGAAVGRITRDMRRHVHPSNMRRLPNGDVELTISVDTAPFEEAIGRVVRALDERARRPR